MARISDPHESQPKPQPQPNNGKTVLLAEDDPFISRMYQTKLEGAGYTVILVANGRDAYAQIKEVNPDLALMDINMPELSGLEVINALHSEGKDDLVKRVVVLTNSANSGDRDVADRFSIEYMVKAEVTPREVLDYINERLGVQGKA